MSSTVRAFLAIELDSGPRSAVAGVIDTLVKARLPGLRPVRPERVHVTVKFLGNIDAGQVEAVTNAVSRTASEHDPLSLRLGPTGAFPNTRAPRVLWIGLEGDVTLLRSLQGAMEDPLAGLGFERERRGFSPHLTVARIRGRNVPGKPAKGGGGPALSALGGGYCLQGGRRQPYAQHSWSGRGGVRSPGLGATGRDLLSVGFRCYTCRACNPHGGGTKRRVQ